jgi:hypothetical protein
MTTNESFVIYVEPTIVGCKLSLSVLENKTYSSWAVKDAFNGLTREVSIDESIEGFFTANSMVDLYIFDNNHKNSIIKNVKILEKNDEVSENV